MEDSEQSSIRLSPCDYPQHTSSHLIPMYHNSGYVSPPYSSSMSARMDASFTTASSGLGITRSTSPWDDRSTIYSSPSTMLSLNHSNHQCHTHFDERIATCENEGQIQASDFGYLPDPMQEGKFVARSYDERPELCEATSRAYWQTQYTQDYSGYYQLPVSKELVLNTLKN